VRYEGGWSFSTPYRSGFAAGVGCFGFIGKVNNEKVQSYGPANQGGSVAIGSFVYTLKQRYGDLERDGLRVTGIAASPLRFDLIEQGCGHVFVALWHGMSFLGLGLS
jgi:hypothetical protein